MLDLPARRSPASSPGPGFGIYLAGRTVNTFGNGLSLIALAFAVLAKLHSSEAVGELVAANTGGMAICTLAGGTLADRWSRHRLIVSASLMAGASQLVTAVLLAERASLGPILLAQLAVGTSEGLVGPAAGAQGMALLTSDTPSRLSRLRVSSTLAGLAGAAGGGLLSSHPGPEWALAIDAGTFVVSGLLLGSVRINGGRGSRAVPSASLRDGMAVVRRARWFTTTVAVSLLTNAAFSGSMTVLGPSLASEGFGRVWWGMVCAGILLGAVLGAVLAGRVAERVHLSGALAVSAGGAAVLVALALRLPPPVVVALSLPSGAAVELFAVVWLLTVKNEVPDQYMGRFMAFDSLSFLAAPLGEIGAGFSANWLGGRVSFGLAAVVVSTAALARARSRSVRALVS